LPQDRVEMYAVEGVEARHLDRRAFDRRAGLWAQQREHAHVVPLLHLPEEVPSEGARSAGEHDAVGK
jgi:hypothetical protein